MATLTVNTNRRGVIKASGGSARGSTYDDVRENSSFVQSTTNSPTSDDANAILYNKVSAGRGGSQWSFNRTYAHFDLSSIPGGSTINSVTLGVSSSGADFDDGVYVLKSTAFGGNGGSDLASSDYYSSIDYTTQYITKITTWPGSGGNAEYTLNSTAVSDVSSNSRLIIAFVDGYDFDDTDTGFLVAASRGGFEFSEGASVMNLTVDYTPASSGDIDQASGVSFSNISHINNVTKANIAEIDGISAS